MRSSAIEGAMSEQRFLELAAPGIPGLSPYVPGKPIEELERELGITDTIKLASNENPLGPSPLAVAAAAVALHGVNLYPDDLAFRLRNKLAATCGCDADGILVGSGSSDVIDMVARTFLAPGCNAVFSRHAFAMYAIYTQAVGAEGRAAPPNPADHPSMPFGHDLEAMAARVDRHTRVVFIANPNNPTGTWLARDELESFIASLPEHVIVLLDEAYAEYVTEIDYPDGAEWLARFPNLVVTRTFSKLYGLAGLRIGYGMANADLAALIGRVRHPFNANSVALAAAEAALDDLEFLERGRQNNTRGLAQLTSAFQELKLERVPSVANFVLVNVRRNGAEVYAALLREGVIVRPVGNYGLPEHLRVTVGTESENARVVTALAGVLGR
jgi:histidinol-phosphate aminotransferase